MDCVRRNNNTRPNEEAASDESSLFVQYDNEYENEEHKNIERMWSSSPVASTSTSGCTSTPSDEAEHQKNSNRRKCNVRRVSTNTNVTIVDGKFFKMVHIKCTSKITVATCVKCEPKKTEIRGGSTSSSILRHLERMHGDLAVTQYKKYVQEKQQQTQRARCTETVMVTHGRRKIGTYMTQDQFDQQILNFIIHAMVPLRIVDDPYFITLVSNSNSGDVHVMSRRTLGRQLDTLFIREKDKIKHALNDIKFLCTTADIWSGRRRSFFGVTCHYIEEETFIRKSVALACRRFTGNHTGNKICDILSTIHAEYNILPTRITATVTDNGANFRKAFKDFGFKTYNIDKVIEQEEILDDDLEENNDSGPDPDIVDLHRNMNTNSLALLPHHIKCSAHTLSLCVTTDLMKAIKNDVTLSSLHKRVMNKCNIL